MAIKGSLKEASLPDVLQLLALGQKTGCLALSDRSSFGYIFFEQGSISYASIVNRRDRLGDLLVKNGLLAPEALAAAVEEQGTGDERRLGEILVERGAITRAQLEQYIRMQIEEAVYFLFTWTQGSFNFEPEQRPEEGAFLVSINPENLLLEGARRVDEWSLIEKKIPSLDMVFLLDPALGEHAADELTPEQRKIRPLVDGRRSVREVVEESGLVEFEVGKALFGLIQAGFAHPHGRKSAKPAEAVSPARVQEHRNLGIAFYRTGMYEESVREFRRVLELQPADLEARFYLGLVGLRTDDPRRAIRYFKETVEAGARWGAVFSNLALALERLGRLDDALLAADEALRLAPAHPRIALSRAVLLARLGRLQEAREAFARYAAMRGGDRPPAVYYAFAMLAEAACGEAQEAVRLGEEGVRHYPHVAQVLLHLGAVRERLGTWDEAELLYRRAVEEGGGVPQAHKSLADALYRRGAHEEAAASYQRSLELGTGGGDDAWFKLGNIRYKLGQREEAVRCWREALARNAENSIARTNLELVAKVLEGAGS
jgi:tetratricopeptide (TPR) repeat protein